MSGRRVATVVVVVLMLVSAVLAVSAFGQADRFEEKATGVVQYKLVSVPNTMTQAQLQTVLTTQGNAGYRLLMPYAVGTGPIPNQTVLVFSKP